MAELRTRVASGARMLGDVAEVFGPRGEASRCFCQYFCVEPGTFRMRGADNRDLMRTQLDEGPQGIVTYRGDVPVGWVQVGPLARYPGFLRTARYGSVVSEPPLGTWAITCFVVRVGHRRQGVTATLLDAAVHLAGACGAPAVDAHPYDTEPPRASSPAAELFVGAKRTFTRAGFRVVGRTSPRRPVVRRRLDR